MVQLEKTRTESIVRVFCQNLYSQEKDAGGARDFPADQGKFLQESFVDFKKIERRAVGKAPWRRPLATVNPGSHIAT